MWPLPLQVTAPSSQPSPSRDKQLTPRDWIRRGRKKLKVSTLFQGVRDTNTKNSQQLAFVNRKAFRSIQTDPAVAPIQEEKQTPAQVQPLSASPAPPLLP